MRSSVRQDGGLERIWRTSILPLLEELRCGEDFPLDGTYGLVALHKAIAAKTPRDDKAA